MQKEILITFYNQGLRSYIEVDLCRECPRQDNKGCCGYYSPIFYPTDFAYLLKVKPELIDYIFNLPDITVLDASVTINSSIDGNSYKCKFHTNDSGCLLDQNFRESICRHFVCPGINWTQEEELKPWQEFFDLLSDFEIDLNNKIADKLKKKGLNLRNPETRNKFFEELMNIFQEETQNLPDFFSKHPKQETFKITRTLKFGTEWPL
ncbi:MAG: hypothetical protein GX790_02860 [Syntrophomonadaceae bacterium]|nr:hypothetical protein [Syntrophomonadaceae bacterium]